MNQKSFLFVGSWMQPLKTLPVQQRWNVLEAIVEYATSGTVPESLDPMERIAFGFIRNEIDRMHSRRTEVCRKRRAAAAARWGKDQEPAKQSDANACNRDQADAPYDIESVSESNSESVSGSEPKSAKTSSSTSMGVRVKGNASTHLIFALGEKINRERKSRFQEIASGAILPGQAKGILGIDKYIDGQGRRTYNGVDIIPHDAPPRPGRAFYWNEITQSWDDIQ